MARIELTNGWEGEAVSPSPWYGVVHLYRKAGLPPPKYAIVVHWGLEGEYEDEAAAWAAARLFAAAPTPQADAMAAKLAERAAECRQLIDLIAKTGDLGRVMAEGLEAQLREMEGGK